MAVVLAVLPVREQHDRRDMFKRDIARPVVVARHINRRFFRRKMLDYRRMVSRILNVFYRRPLYHHGIISVFATCLIQSTMNSPAGASSLPPLAEKASHI